MRPLLALAVCALLAAGAAAAAVEQANTTNKFRQREASDDMLGYPHL
jgi:outer membrane biogenesis lipoprotein LolB